MQVFARHPGGRNRGADGFLVAIHLGGVEVPVAQRQPALDRGAAGIALHAKRAEAELRQADTLGVQWFHDGSGTGEGGAGVVRAASTVFH